MTSCSDGSPRSLHSGPSIALTTVLAAAVLAALTPAATAAAAPQARGDAVLEVDGRGGAHRVEAARARLASYEEPSASHDQAPSQVVRREAQANSDSHRARPAGDEKQKRRLKLDNSVGSALLLKRARSGLGRHSRYGVHTSLDMLTGNLLESIPKTFKSGLFPVLCGFVLLGCCLSCNIIYLTRGSTGGRLNDREAGLIEGEEGEAIAGDGEQRPVEKDIKRRPEGLDEDLYGMGLAALIRDSQRFAMKTEKYWLRMSRLTITLLILLFTMLLQVFLLVQMKHLVTSVTTREARETYDEYEIWMYGGNTSNMTVTENGYHRGKEGNFDVTRFDTLDDDLKDNACQMPLSQPTFFIAILLVWTLVCASEMRHTFELAGSLLVSTPTVASMVDSLEETEEEGDEAVIVIGLTMQVKTIAAIFILVPRFIVSLILLWLGCRWLTGTMGFSDVLQNAVTLEFILLLKDLFYATMAPHQNKIETRNTLLLPYSTEERPTASVFLGAFLWGGFSIFWVLTYIELWQQVLPDYQWDIHEACINYLTKVESTME